MKKNYFALAMAAAMAFALVGCSADQTQNSMNPGASSSPSAGVESRRPENSAGLNTDDPSRSSAGIGSDAQNSSSVDDNGGQTVGNGGSQNGGGTGMGSGVLNTPDVNDADEGGGAGGTNDIDNDGEPETEGQIRSYTRQNGGLDDTGRMVGDVTRGIGNAARDVGDAIGNAANNVGNAVR